MEYPARGENWGRWGDDDERGVLNLLTPDAVRAAAQLVRRGRVFNLAMPVRNNQGPVLGSRAAPVHVSRSRTYEGCIISDDLVVLHTHGVSTHMDALGHVAYGGMHYNGHPAPNDSGAGLTRLGIDAAGWVFTRGVIADVATWCGVERLEPGYAVTAADLDATLAERGLAVRPGDALLVRTGHSRLAASDAGGYTSSWPGLGPDTVDWIAAHQPCLVATDNPSVEVSPSPPDTALCVHKRALRDLGIHLMEMASFEEPAREKALEGLFVAAPLRLIGGTASPLTPLLID
jgi:kynurenine formamidase